MPTYQYACTECGGQLEVVQKFTDDALTVHEECGGKLRKVYSPVGIVFKGSGFYRNDSRSTGSGGSSTAAKPGEKSGEKSSESSSPSGDSGSKSSESSSSKDSSSSSSGKDSSSSSSSSSSAGKSSGEKVA